MKMLNTILVFLALLSVSCQRSKGLFQETGRDWDRYGDATWTFSGDELTGRVTDGVGFVMTQETYRDMLLELEFNPDSTVNSGIFVRCRDKDINPIDCYELNIWDLHPDQDSRTGAIVTKEPPLAYVETNNQWNSYKIRAQGNRIQAWVNGRLTADILNDDLREGYIGLQASGTGVVRFRRVRITRLRY
jgi:hypothetical protein